MPDEKAVDRMKGRKVHASVKDEQLIQKRRNEMIRGTVLFLKKSFIAQLLKKWQVNLTSLRKKSPTSKRESAEAPVKVGDEFRLGVA
jgi:hypothetical protein